MLDTALYGGVVSVAHLLIIQEYRLLSLYILCYSAMSWYCDTACWQIRSAAAGSGQHLHCFCSLQAMLQVVFVATANQLQSMSGPLLDRLEIIQLSGYTLEEKRHIAEVAGSLAAFLDTALTAPHMLQSHASELASSAKSTASLPALFLMFVSHDAWSA